MQQAPLSFPYPSTSSLLHFRSPHVLAPPAEAKKWKFQKIVFPRVRDAAALVWLVLLRVDVPRIPSPCAQQIEKASLQ